MTEVASSVVNEVLGKRAHEVDKPIVDYVINVLADEDFDFGADGEGFFEALDELLVELLIDSGWVPDFSDSRSVCSKLSEKFGKHGLVKAKPTVRSLTAPLRMFDDLTKSICLHQGDFSEVEFFLRSARATRGFECENR